MPTTCSKLLAWFGVPSRRRKNHGSAYGDRECLLRGFAVKALGREPHCVISGGRVSMSQDCTLGCDSVAKIPMMAECGNSLFRNRAGEDNFFSDFRLSRDLEDNRRCGRRD